MAICVRVKHTLPLLLRDTGWVVSVGAWVALPGVSGAFWIFEILCMPQFFLV